MAANDPAESTLRVLMIGLEAKAELFVTEAFAPGDDRGSVEFDRVLNGDQLMAQYDQWNDDSYDLIVCGVALSGMSAIEVGQVLVNQCPGALKYYVTFDATNYEPRMLLKNGFTAAFAFPMDGPIFKKSLVEDVFSGKRSERSFRTVRLLDIHDGDKLGFDAFIFMPLNKKYVRYVSGSSEVDPAKIKKLQTRQMSQLHVDHRDMNKFYRYSAAKLRELGDSGGVSSTERQAKLKDCVRTLFNDIFDQSLKADFDAGREMVKQCESIISNYITKGASSTWYKKLLSSVGDGLDSYNHASNVSTFAALFGIGLGHKRPEDLAMAGLFHDLGIAQLPLELQSKKESEMSEAEKNDYYRHPEASLTMIKSKRLIIPEIVEKAIAQHHEHWQGKGGPKKHAGARICEDAQILSFADQFDDVTRIEEGRPGLRPLEALESIRANGSIDPDLIARLRSLLEQEQGGAMVKVAKAA